MKESVTIKHRYTRGFTVLPNNVLRDSSLSWGATGLLAFLMHLPENFQLYLSFLSKQKRDGRDSTRARIKELEALGYIEIRRERDSRGQYSKMSWDVIIPPERPTRGAYHPGSENPTLDDPLEEKPRKEKPTLINTNNKKILNEIKTTTTKALVDNSGPDALKRLFYPPGLLEGEPQALYKALKGIPAECAQQLLDELTAVMQKPGALHSTPQQFLHGLIKKYRDNLFTPSAGKKIAKRRELDN